MYLRAILEFYSNETPFTSNKILVGENFEEKEWLEQFLTQKFNKKISILLPTTKEKQYLIKLAKINALEVIKNQKENSIIYEIKNLFNLKNIPYKIETFDTSHIKS